MPAQDEYIVEILRDLGFISHEDILKAKERAKTEAVGLVDALIAMGRITHMDVSKALASQFNMDTINLAEYRVPDDVLALVPKHVARRYKVVPVYKHDNTITVAISDPLDVDTVDSLRYILRMNVEPVVAAKNDIEASITRYYGSADDTVENMLQEITEGEIDLGLTGDKATETKIDEVGRDRRRRADHQAGRVGHHGGVPQPGERYSHRATGEAAPGAVSDRRRAP